MATLIRKAEHKLNEMNRNPRQMIEKFSHDLGDEIGSFIGDVSNKTNTYVKNTRGYVEEHPLQSVAIAAVSGLALGSLLTFVSRRSH